MARPWPPRPGRGDGWEGPRRRLGQRRAVGILVDWQHRAGKSFGWVLPIHGLPEQLPAASSHGGDLYVHWDDIQDPRLGSVVTFWPYVDKQGLGAEDCVSRSVLRFIVPQRPRRALTLPRIEANPCPMHLPTSIFYPELESKRVTMRKYLWDSPFIVYELWGLPHDILDAADMVGLLTHPEAEVLVSRRMAKHEPPDCLRDIDRADLPDVPPPFRVALALRGEGSARERLLTLLGA
mmetsp:Transcript_92034/g.260530  ORF Transcript_92034/g.260530 Transcript_92034/m.260530 type:complete len:236 (+) Transcript_92034:101-808(+)